MKRVIAYYPGLHVVEGTHDMQTQVSEKRSKVGDTRHGMFNCTIMQCIIIICCYYYVGAKNESELMKKVSQGNDKNREVTWLHKLVNKRKMLQTF